MRTYSHRKTVLVTGGASFLGSHLIDRLLARGDEVICVDNLFTGTKQNIEHLHGHPHFEFLRHDVTFSLFIEVDEIYNLACPASPIHYQHDPVQTTKTSVHGAINMLGLAKRLKVRIFQASTSEVYGDPTVHPQTEAIGETSTQLEAEVATTRANAAPKPYSLIIIVSTGSTSESRVYSTPTVPECIRTMGGWSAISSCRRYRTRTSRCMATDFRRAVSATLTISLRVRSDSWICPAGRTVCQAFQDL